MTESINRDPYFKAVEYDQDPDTLGAGFVPEGTESSPISYTKTDSVKEPARVVPMDYKRCIGMITFIFDLVIALLKRCFCKTKNPEDLPCVSYVKTVKDVKIVEHRQRNTMKSEVGIEFDTLVEKVEECVKEVRSDFSQKDAEAAVLIAAKNWNGLSKIVTSGKTTKFFSAGPGEHGLPIAKAYRSKGYLMPPVVIKRHDEIRNQKLFATYLTIQMPVNEQGLDKSVVLYRGNVTGKQNATGRELSRRAADKEGLLIELGNSEGMQKAKFLKVVGIRDNGLVDSLTHTVRSISKELMPSAGEVTLYSHVKEKGAKQYILHARDLIVGRLDDLCEQKRDIREGEVKSVVDRIVAAAAGEPVLGKSLHVISYECFKGETDKKWQVRILFTPKSAEKKGK